jgi:hypothetical protein
MPSSSKASCRNGEAMRSSKRGSSRAAVAPCRLVRIDRDQHPARSIDLDVVQIESEFHEVEPAPPGQRQHSVAGR